LPIRVAKYREAHADQRGVLLDVPVSGVQCDEDAVLSVSTPDVGPGEEALVTGVSWAALLGGAILRLFAL